MKNYEDTRPYNDCEVPAALKRIAENIYFPEIVKFIAPKADINLFAKDFKKIKTVGEFQEKIMRKVLEKIIENSMDSLSYSGLENLSKEKKSVFISNHRDIVLDSAFLVLIFVNNGFESFEITFGSNLMNPQTVVDIGKLNKMFKIVRGGTAREIFANSQHVSGYIRFAILQKNESVWLAQRNGRTKDGFDKTEAAILKMLAMSSKKKFAENFAELNLTPVAVSYEYEPCDFMKTREVYVSRRQTYTKQPGEDLLSILHGIKQPKGNVHFSVCKPISVSELNECGAFNSDKFKKLAEITDRRIFSNYKLWKTNFIAHDLLCGKTEFSDRYSAVDKAAFVLYMEKGLEKIEGNKTELRAIFLGIYANPVDSACTK